MISAYYNEFDPKAAAWLRQLIKNGNITPGEVDERSITEVKPADIEGFDRVHFFAGVGTWDYCLNQAGWGDRSIWTASLPCQPFSAAGKGLGKADERHLLPHFLNLVRECKPSTIIGEQVAAAIGHGWLDDLYAEMEACDYAIGSAVIGAHSVGSAHIRQRLYWVANSINHSGERSIRGIYGKEGSIQISDRKNITIAGEPSGTSEYVCGVANSNITGKPEPGHREPLEERLSDGVIRGCEDGRVSDSKSVRRGILDTADIRQADGESNAFADSSNSFDQQSQGLQFADVEWIYCRDNKYRPIKPGILPLVNGAARGMVHSSDSSEPINANATQEARAMRLKGYGNAIQAQTAIAFIAAFKEVA